MRRRVGDEIENLSRMNERWVGVQIYRLDTDLVPENNGAVG